MVRTQPTTLSQPKLSLSMPFEQERPPDWTPLTLFLPDLASLGAQKRPGLKP
jgi:hypothetical protein